MIEIFREPLIFIKLNGNDMKSMMLRNTLFTAVAVLILTSCIEDELTYRTGKEICFFINDGTNDKSKIANTRSDKGTTEALASYGSLTGVIPMGGTQGGDKHYLHAFVSDIDANPLAGDSRNATRATPQDDIGSYGNFGINAYLYSGSWSENLKPEFMYNVDVCEREFVNGKELWKPTRTYYWPEKGGKLRFFAYAPYNATGLTLSGPDVAGTPRLDYVVPSDAANQCDLLAAASDEYADSNKGPISLTFDHILTGVRFSVASDMPKGRITRILIRNIYNQGRYVIGEKAWTVTSTSPVNFVQIVNKAVGGTELELTPRDLTFMLMPQTVPANASIEVEYTEAITNKTLLLTCGIAGTQWEPGKLITYRLSTSSIAVEPVIEVTSPDDFTYKGGGQTLSINSYLLLYQSGKEAAKVNAPWIAEYFDETSGTWTKVKPGWAGVSSSGNGGVNGPVGITVNFQDGQYVDSPHNLKLKGRTAKYTKKSPFNLATEKCDDNEGNTANCYIVNDPGYYKLPVVYGNSVKNGKKTPEPYTSKLAAGSNVLKNFVNAYGEPISDSHIYHDCEKTLTDAVLVWQDVKGLVTDVKLSGDKKKLLFNVPAGDTFQQGNALVAVRDKAGVILWSWHIWVTDFVPELPPTVVSEYDHDQTQRDKAIANLAGEQYTLMGVPIGWVDGDIYRHEGRSVKVRFKHTTGAAECFITLNQLPYVLRTFRAPYFQWGRKDPIMPVSLHTIDLYGDALGRECYDVNGNVVPYKKSTSQATVADAIQNPDVSYFTFYAGELGGVTHRGWCSEEYYNLWSLNDAKNRIVQKDEPVVKTIYDPSPRGYCVPPTNTFTGITFNGEHVLGEYPPSAGFINTPYKESNQFRENIGFIFYCNRMPGEGIYDPSGGIWYLPALGYRPWMAGNRFTAFMNGGTYHTASHSTGFNAFYVVINGGLPISGNTEPSAGPRTHGNISDARPMLPVREYSSK